MVVENDKPAAAADVPIEIVRRRLACENTKFFVYFDHLVNRAGLEVKDYLVVAPKIADGNLVTGVAILPIIDESVALLRIYRPALRAYSWEIPQGFVDEGESNESAASRELVEETGLAVEPRALASLGYITPDPGVLAARVHLYVADRCSRSGKVGEEFGLQELRFLSFHEFERMIVSSEIQDSVALAAWCRYRLNTL